MKVQRTKPGKSKYVSRTDWARVDAMRDADIVIDEDSPELDEEFWAHAETVMPPKIKLSLRVDPDIVAWFKKQGRGYQTRMHAVLRFYYRHMLRKRKDPSR